MNTLAIQATKPDQREVAIARPAAFGDTGFLESIMRRHNRMLYRIARSILRDDAQAEDCLQSAYLLAFRSIASSEQAKLSSAALASLVIDEALDRKRPAAQDSRDLVPKASP